MVVGEGQIGTGVVSLEEYVVHVGTLDILHYWKDTHWMTCTVKLNFPNTGNDRRFSSNDQLFIECQCKSEQMHSNHDSHRKDTKNGVLAPDCRWSEHNWNLAGDPWHWSTHQTR
uniref:Uncharacterized protein n=1 Tax=Phocoena sinus TaxID=42100 RepID=A0A8C9BF14_PHOSS